MSPPAADAPSPVHIPGTERHELSSKHTGRVYDISIGLPEGYADTDNLYPAVFVLDGQWDFKLVMSVYGALSFDMHAPDAILVGIASGGENPDHEALRIRDYTPTEHPHFEGSGDADRFLAFLTEELIPFVEQRLRVDETDRTLLGSSLGGLFALHALFTKPDLFDRLVIVSPAIFWHEEFVTYCEGRLAGLRSDLPVRLYLAAGELEPSNAFLHPLNRLVDRVRSREYRDLLMTNVVISGERHAGVKAEAFTRGLRWVFTNPGIDLSADALVAYAGEYQLDNHDPHSPSPWWPGPRGMPHLRLRVEGTRLVVDAEVESHDADELVPVAKDTFTFRGGIPGDATFRRDTEGSVDQLSIRLRGQTITMDRVH